MYVHAGVAFQKPQVCVYQGTRRDNCTVWGPNDPHAHLLFAPEDINTLPTDPLIKTIKEILAKIR